MEAKLTPSAIEGTVLRTTTHDISLQFVRRENQEKKISFLAKRLRTSYLKSGTMQKYLLNLGLVTHSNSCSCNKVGTIGRVCNFKSSPRQGSCSLFFLLFFFPTIKSHWEFRESDQTSAHYFWTLGKLWYSNAVSGLGYCLRGWLHWLQHPHFMSPLKVREKIMSKINLAFHTRDTFPSIVLVSVENRKITPTVQKSMKTRLHAESHGMAQHASLSCVIWFKITHTGCQGYTQKTIQASKSFYNKDFHTRANINTSHAHKTMNTQGKSHLTKEVSPEHSLAS